MNEQITALVKELNDLLSNRDPKIMTIKTQSECDFAAPTAGRVKKLGVQIDEARREQTAPLDAAKKAIMDEVRVYVSTTKPLGLCNQVEADLKLAMGAFLDASEAKRKKEQARKDEQARKRQAKLVVRAEVAAAKGQTETAEALEDEALSVIPDQVAGVTTGTGSGSRMRNVIESVDREKFFAAAVGNPMLEPYLLIDMAGLQRLADAQKTLFNVPGITTIEQRIMSVRRG